MTRNWRIEVDTIEVTLGGSYCTEPDTFKRFIPGMSHYYIDDIEVTEEAFMAAREATP